MRSMPTLGVLDVISTMMDHDVMFRCVDDLRDVTLFQASPQSEPWVSSRRDLWQHQSSILDMSIALDCSINRDPTQISSILESCVISYVGYNTIQYISLRLASHLISIPGSKSHPFLYRLDLRSKNSEDSEFHFDVFGI